MTTAEKYGYKQDGSIRQRPIRTIEFSIFDLQCDEVPDDHPEHIAWQKIVKRRCEEIQGRWNEAEWERRRCDKIEPLTFEEMR